MTIYFVDTNIILRYLLKDNLLQAQKAKAYFDKAKARKIQLILIPEIILEVEYVLRHVYQYPKINLVEDLEVIVDNQHLDVKHRSVLQSTIKLYKNIPIDLVDAVLFSTAEENNAKVLSFDKDFQKLAKVKL